MASIRERISFSREEFFAGWLIYELRPVGHQRLKACVDLLRNVHHEVRPNIVVEGRSRILKGRCGDRGRLRFH